MTLPDSLNEGDAEHVTPATNEMGMIVAEQIQASFLPLLSASFYPLPGPTCLLFKVGQLWGEPGILPGEVAVSCPGDPPSWLLWALIQASAVFRAQRQVTGNFLDFMLSTLGGPEVKMILAVRDAERK